MKNINDRHDRQVEGTRVLPKGAEAEKYDNVEEIPNDTSTQNWDATIN